MPTYRLRISCIHGHRPKRCPSLSVHPDPAIMTVIGLRPRSRPWLQPRPDPTPVAKLHVYLVHVYVIIKTVT